ncbi:MAG TPA: DmsC/YnfH family molybdoenzyme membrane anchor subunit, partial [Verrucomicrobiae bacterium]|nr:DmsC/YnfH family molybdoenzyme membrane anchor subunit [Verrucomicrobiae bacterium]
FEVDLDACSGCKACVTACHSLNGLDEGETWREVGTLLGGANRVAVQQTITSACHHCADPGCLSGCPVLAYEKDPVTGIVRHLDDQCIGCQYCILKCPYEVPKYSASRGIVRKCDMCHNRLAAGEAPACVQACPNGAITIRIVNRADLAREARQGDWLPDSPDPAITTPSTRYRGKKADFATLQAGDHYELRPAKEHPPLVFMLVLTQLSVGVVLIQFLLRLAGAEPGLLARKLSLVAANASCGAGLIASVFHLGRPMQAWKSFLGWRTSWLSREVIAFGTYAPLLAIYSAVAWLEILPALAIPLGAATVITGLGGVVCSVMLYADTRRAFWSLPRAAGKFLGTTLLLGFAAWLAITVGAGAPAPLAGAFELLLLGASAAKLLGERALFGHLGDSALTPLKRSALLMLGELGLFCRARFTLGALAGILLPAAALVFGLNGAVAAVIFAGCLIAEFCERHLFFRAEASRRMPGAL